MSRVTFYSLLLLASYRIRPGTVALVTVRHDAGCPRINGGGECLCTPDIIVSAPVEASPSSPQPSYPDLN